MEDKLDKCISKLDTATGMLIVAAMKDNTVKEAMNLVSEVSIELGDMIVYGLGGRQ